MIIDAVGAFSITVVNLFFWFLTFSKRRLTSLAKAYLWWSFYITVWSFGYGITLSGWLDYNTTLAWNKFCQAMATLIAPYFFRFGCEVADRFKENKKVFRFYLFFGVANALCLFITPYYVKGLWSFGYYRYQPLGGPLYIVFTLFFFWCTIHGFMVAAQAFKMASGRTAKQMKLFLLGTGIAYSGGSTLFLQGYGLPIPTWGVFLILGYVVIIAYAVHKYQFMAIPELVRKTLVFAGLVSFVFGVFAVVTFLIQDVLGRYVALGQWPKMLVGIFLIVLGYEPIRELLTEVTDRYLFQKKEDFRTVLNRLTRSIITILDLHEVGRSILATLESSLRIESGAILVQEENEKDYSVLNDFGIDNDEFRLNPDDPLIRFFKTFEGIVNLETIERGRKFPVAVKERLARFNAVIAVPLFMGKDLIGILFLGRKKSDQEYTQDEIEYFPTVAGEVAIALSNARHYDEAVKRRKEAEESREEALAAKKKTEEMELELVRREKLLFVEKLVKGLAHEIFNPMQPMMYCVEQIDRTRTDLFLLFDDLKSSMNQDQKRLFLTQFKTIKENVGTLAMGMDHIKSVVDTLNQLQQKDDKSIRPFDFKAFWKVTQPMLEMEMHGEGGLALPQITADIPKGIPPVLGNSTQLAQVMINLFRNALHAMEGSPEKQIRISGEIDPENLDYLRIRFSDTGSGIPPEILHKIFDFGFTTKDKKGQGIGLNQCRLIIEKFFNGTIECSSEAGKGATFILRIPFAKTVEGEEVNAN